MSAVLEFLAGMVIVMITFRDLVQTVVVPGGARNSLEVSRHLVSVALPLWTRGHRREIGVSFAPTILIASFTVWVLLLILGLALMAHASAARFSPPLTGFGHALFAAGGAFTTIGTGRAQPSGTAALVVVGAGLTGLASMTMAVTYVLEVQSSVHERDRGVLKISTSAGDPPSALALLEHYASLECRGELDSVLRNGRDWCAAVLQTHASHPWLIYFRTPSVGTAWPTSLGVVMDLALIFELLIDDKALGGLASLTRLQASSLGTELAKLLKLEQVNVDAGDDEVCHLLERLRHAGYRVRENADRDEFRRARARCAGTIESLCRHVGADGAPLTAPAHGLDPP